MLIIDAGVALKWVIEEDDSAAAAAVVERHALVAPDLLHVECANVLWNRARRRLLLPDLAEAALTAIAATPVRLLPTANFVGRAQALAFALDESVHHCIYLAAALEVRACLLTADRRFAAAARRNPAYASWVRLLDAG